MDNGFPWGTQKPLPSALALWLAGHDITPVYIRPRRSTDNGVVERDHGVLNQWVEPHACADFATCQQQLEWAATTQRERYRLPGELSRTQRHPELFDNPRMYDPDRDEQTWDISKVGSYLAEFTFKRKVSINGRINLFANRYSVGRRYARQDVEIVLDAHSHEWMVSDGYGRELKRVSAKELDYQSISQLRLALRRRN